jgi:hypothetical protein
MGATSAAGARLAAELPGIPALDLVELLDAGLVREGAEGSYYVYERARSVDAPVRAPHPNPPVPRAVMVVLLLILIVGIPVLFLWLSRGPMRGTPGQ